MSQQQGQLKQWILIGTTIAITAIIAVVFWMKGKTPKTEETESAPVTTSTTAPTTTEKKEKVGIELSPKQLIEQGIKLETVDLGAITQNASFPAKLVVNSDRQAHVAPGFAGKVETVAVELGEYVKKGQLLATLVAPDLINQQADLQMARSNLTLAEQEYQREKYLWSQGVSAKQDYQRAYHAYQQAQIQVKAIQDRIAAFGHSSSNGRYQIVAPISGVISKKDLTVGENVQLADPLFTIEQLDQLWLEFVLPSTDIYLTAQQTIHFKSVASGNTFQAQVQTLSTEADAQTGRLQVRAKVLSKSNELRPNLMVNVLLDQQSQQQQLRIEKAAVQLVKGQTIIFIAKPQGENTAFIPQPVQLGRISSDGQWVEVKSGLEKGQVYVTQGSFLFKSELEKEES